MRTSPLPPRLLIIKTGETLPPIRARRGDFEHWIAERSGQPLSRFDVAYVEGGEALPSIGGHAGVIVTGSPAMVSERLPWSVRSGDWLAEAVAADVFVLGICYGHQLLAQALGAEAGVNPRGREIGSVRIALNAAGEADALLGGLGAPWVQETHSESVLSLPEGAELLASSPGDPHQAFRLRRSWGVQFHPEFDADVMRAYIAARREPIAAEGLDPDALHAAVRESDHGVRLLHRFVELVDALTGAG